MKVSLDPVMEASLTGSTETVKAVTDMATRLRYQPAL
jgi:hypothetical protein